MSDDTINFLLKQASRAPLLNKGQEVELGRQIRAWLNATDPDARTIRRGQRAKKKLIECNIKLVVHCAKKYQARIKGNPSISFEDLIQEGCLGLNRAAEKFDPERGYAFSTYSFNWIRQSMGRMIDMNSGSIRVSNHVVHTALAWRYRPEGMTVEEFAKSRNMTTEKAKQWLELHARAQCSSLDCKVKEDDDRGNSLIDYVPVQEIDDDVEDYARILDDLKYLDDGVLREPLALLELAEEAKSTEIADLMGWGRHEVAKRLKDCRSTVREHLPAHIREAIVGAEQKIKPATIVKPQPAPVRELVAVGCNAAPPSSMTQSIQPTQNGHSRSLEAEAMEVIEAVKSEPSEPVAEAVKPKRRARRSAAEIQAEKDAKGISVIVDGVSLQGDVDDIAKLIGAIQKAA